MARLMAEGGGAPAARAEWPLHYLLRCYTRASDEFRAAPGALAREPGAVQRVQSALLYAKGLAVSYAGLLLIMSMFPQVTHLHPCPRRYAHHSKPGTNATHMLSHGMPSQVPWMCRCVVACMASSRAASVVDMLSPACWRQVLAVHAGGNRHRLNQHAGG